MAAALKPLLPVEPSELRRRAQQQGARESAVQSLDYEQPVSAVWLRHQRESSANQQRHIWGYSGSTFTKTVATVVSGVIIGVTAAALQLAVDLAARRRAAFLDALLQTSGYPPFFAALLAISLGAVLATTLVVHFLAPKAAGGGVAAVMALLNGNEIRGLLDGSIYVVKLLGTAAARLAGLALGIEGPMVHLGACVASLVCHAEHAIYRRANLHRGGGGKQGGDAAGGDAAGSTAAAAAAAAAEAGAPVSAAETEWLFSNSDHRELVTAGAAAGLAAAFGAPIGGVLFALEEATSVWSRKLAWRCFVCAAVSCFTMAQLHPRMHSGMLSFQGLLPLTNLQWLIQLPLLVAVSAGGGLLGSLFNVAKRRVRGWKQRQSSLAWRLARATAVTLITVGTATLLPAVAGTCLQLPESWDAGDVVRLRCPAGSYNDLATGMQSSAVFVIRSLLSLGSEDEPVNNRLCSLATPCYYSAPSLALLVVSYVLLFFLASELIVPGGLFMPCILIGSAWGALVTLLLLQVLPAGSDLQPGIYAVVGATAMLGATFRSSISLVVVVVEGTGGIDLLFGVIMAVIVSNWLAHHMHPDGLYEQELEAHPSYYLRQEPPHALRMATAEGIMASPVVALPVVGRVSTVLEVLETTTHNGFPVLASAGKASGVASHDGGDQSGSGGNGVAGGGVDGFGRASGRMVGLVLRSQLLVLLRHGAFCDERGRYTSAEARLRPDAYEEALWLEMQQAAQASSYGYRAGHSGGAAAPVGRLGPATSLGPGGAGFPSIDRTRGGASLAVAAVLDAAADAAAAAVAGGGGAPYLNLASFMHQAPITVRPTTPADRCHHLFLSLSLRHLCVVDWRSRAIGIITRKDLDHAAGVGPWRATDIAPTPRQSPRGCGGLEGDSPSASAWSLDTLARNVLVPPRRLIDAISQRFSSPRPASSLLHRGGSDLAGSVGGASGSTRQPLLGGASPAGGSSFTGRPAAGPRGGVHEETSFASSAGGGDDSDVESRRREA